MPVTSPQGTLDFKKVDKITFVGASSNTVIDTRTGSVGIGVVGDALSSNLHVVGDTRMEGNINMLHTSNTASIKLNSNVVTEFPRSKKLIKYPREAIPGNNSAVGSGYTFSASDGDYTIKVSSEYDHRFYASNAFDNNLSTNAWLSADSAAGYRYTSGNPITSDSLASSTFAKFGEYGEWIELKLPTSIYLGYVLVYPKDVRVDWKNTSAIVWGSNTGNDGDWQRLSTFTSFGNYSESNPAKIVIDSLVSYNYYAYQITGIDSVTASQYSVVSELEYYGTPEYDPEAHGTDVVVKSVPNVPNTDWLEVYYDAKDLADGAVTVNDLKPVGTAINGTVAGNTSVTDGAFTFDGSGDYIETTLGSHISGDWTNTVSFWIAWNAIPTSGAQTPFMIGQPNTSTNGIGVDFNANSSMVYFTTSGDIVTINNVFDLITPGKWIHFTFIHTPSKKYVYWDGKQVGIWTSGGAATLPTSPTLSIGRRGSSPTNYTNAKIANFRLFNRALSSDEIYQLYAYQKEYFGHGDLGITLRAGRLGIGTSEPRATLDVQGPVRIYDTELTNPVFVEFATNYSSSDFSDGQLNADHWRDPSNNILDFNVVTQQSSHNAFDADSAVGVRGSFTVPVEGLYVIYYAALVNRVSTSSHIYVYVNGSTANGTGINSHQNRNTVGSMWTTLTIQRVTRLKRGDKVQCYITGGFYTLGHYCFGSIYQIGA